MSERLLETSRAAEIVEPTTAAIAAVLAELRSGAITTDELAGRVMSVAYAEGERWERSALATGPRLACREGCPWCCYGTRVDVVAPEALVIAAQLRIVGTDPHLIRETARRVEHLSPEDRHRQRVACPLLDAARGRCSVHAIRPLACRGHGSLNAGVCQSALEHSEEDRAIPKHVPLLLAHSAVSAGLRLALGQTGLDGRVLELSSALDVALSHRGAADRWARGEKLFGQAMPSGTRDRDRTAASKNQRKAARRARRIAR
jgi:Fe-S-cluster containining protein